jgi:hypothetical protein
MSIATTNEIKEAIKIAVLAYKYPNLNYPEEDKVALYPLDAATHDPGAAYRPERFDYAGNILFRPGIVRNLQDAILTLTNREFGSGILVNGPHGVGKSHSLVNLVRRLRGHGHIVTFIPDVEQWDTGVEFIDFICRSLGTDSVALGITEAMATDNGLKTLCSIVSNALDERNKDKGESEKVHWILVFDQLNRIFGRPEFQAAKDIGVLPLPFKLMKTLNTYPYVHTVVSASANNCSSYRENHQGFKVYNHALRMTDEEIKIWKPEYKDYDQTSWTDMLQVTGGSPMQISELQKKNSKEDYERETIDTVIIETRKFYDDCGERRKKDISRHAVYCILCTPVANPGSIVYDKKYSVLSGNVLKPIFPAVLVAYRNLFWDDLMEYVEKNERELLATCANENVTNDVRGRLFELIVILRFQKQAVVSKQPTTDVLPAKVDAGLVYESQKLPMPAQMEANSLFIPKNSNFPAIDLILKDDKDVWVVQAHVADHEDVEPTFRRMCDEQGWFDSFDNIYLVYLSPSTSVKESLSCLPATPTRTKKPRLSKVPKPEIQVSAMTKDDFECLRDINWPSAVEDVSMVDT